MANTPYKIVVGPLKLYYAAVGTAAPTSFPDTPSGWTEMAAYQGESGIVITPEQTTEEIFVDNDTAPQKAVRTREGLTVEVPVLDMSPEVMAKANNGVTVTTLTDRKEVPLYRGLDIDEMAVLAYGQQGPVGNDMKAFYWMPRAYVMTHGPKTYVKGEPTMYTVTFRALRHSTERLGKYIVEV